MTVSEVLRSAGYGVDSPCGGAGKCGKCAVMVSGAVSEPDEMERKHGVRLACRAKLLGDAFVSPISADAESHIIETASVALPRGRIDGYGLAVDIGTTTVALKLFGEDGVCVYERGELNPQRSYAADVVGRLNASLNGATVFLREMINDCIYSMVKDGCASLGIHISCISRAVITGNTAMLYLLTGRDVHSIAFAPFVNDEVFGCWTEFFGIPTYLPRVMNGYVGADITCSVLASRMCESEETAILCDIGTNGELALWHKGKLYVTSTAAGPAFEGAEISCGCGGAAGAVDKVWVENGRIAFHTIGEGTEKGICGSGLIDAIASFLQTGILDEAGYADEDMRIGSLCLTREDVSAVQLAKAAVRAGIEVLLSDAGITAEDVQRVYIAGGFGAHLDMRSAAIIGLIPTAFVNKAVSLGNASLGGAAQILFDDNELMKSNDIANGAIHRQLGGDRLFSDSFLGNIGFDAAQ